MDQLLDTILTSLDDDKAQDVLAIDLVGKTSIADRMIVATGTSARMVSAMADHLVRKLKETGIKAQTEGEKHGDWVVIDAGDVIVHLFRPEVRTFYNIERIWAAPATPPTVSPKAKPNKPRAKRAPLAKGAAKGAAKGTAKGAKPAPRKPSGKAAPRKAARRT